MEHSLKGTFLLTFLLHVWKIICFIFKHYLNKEKVGSKLGVSIKSNYEFVHLLNRYLSSASHVLGILLFYYKDIPVNRRHPVPSPAELTIYRRVETNKQKNLNAV